ncbi:MAG: response regulator [Proteobacteria bacterium]|nr:response regulator [Pseudomonadota bacterium]
MKKQWGLTAKLLVVPVTSVTLLVAALAFTGFAQSRYREVARQDVARRVTEARRYAAVLGSAHGLHSQYLDLATARLAGTTGPHEQHGLHALLGATLDLTADVDDLARDPVIPPASARQLQAVSQALTDFQGALIRLRDEASSSEVRADVAASNVEFGQLTSALTAVIASAESRGDRSFSSLEGDVRRSLNLLAVVLLAVLGLTLALALWARRAVAGPLGAVAAAMRRFHADPAAVLALPPRTDDEVGEIVTGLQELAASVRERGRALEESARQLTDGNVALHNEVRERRVAEAQLRQSREFLEAAQAAGGIGVFDLDLDSQVLQGSASFFALQGIQPPNGKITQDQWLALVHPDDLEALVGAFTAAVASGGAYRAEYRLQRLDRTIRWVSSAGRVLHSGGGARRIVGSTMDITERKQAELALAATEARLERAVRGTSDGLVDLDLSRGRLWFAPRVAELLGYRPEQLPSTVRGFARLLAPGDFGRLLAATRMHLHQGAVHDVEFRIRDAAGAWQWLRLRARAAHDAASGAMILSGSLQLVTDRREQAAELERARAAAEQASRAKSEFLANMSHEIRTPINGVIGMTHVLLDTPLSDSQRECVEIVRSSGEALLALVNDILDFSKIEAGKMELEHIDFDARTVVDDALGSVALAALGKDLELVADVTERVPAAVHGDPGRLRQCLINLLSNAVKFTERGHVAVEVDAAADGEATLLTFTVSDTGIGIPADRLDRLFREFSQVDSSTTRHYGGSGLGLSIVKRLAELMGGQVGVTSSAGAGSRFWFTVRLAARATAPAPLPAPTATPVLVLDGQPLAARALARELAAAGCRATVAADETAFGAALATLPPDAIAMIDVRLLSGALAELLTRARHGAGAPRFVLLAPLGLAAAPPAGFDAMLSKPVRRQQLRACLAGLAAAAPTAQSDSAPVASGSGLRVLLVEDNAVNRRVAEHQLRKLGCLVSVACNGIEAVEAALAGGVDLVLMDCQMPLLDGFDATRQIRQREPAGQRLPIIALTANALAGDRDSCLAAGMDDYLSKPLEPAALAASLARWAPPGMRALTPAPASAAGAEPADAAPVDLAALAVLTEGDAGFERELIEVFIASGDSALAALVAALAGGDLGELRRQAHALKGASANLRARPLAARAEELEAAAVAGDLDRCRDALGLLERDYRRTTRFVAARVG